MEDVRREGLERFPGVDALMGLYVELGGRTAALSADTGLACLPRCGQCCETPSINVEAMPFELYPLALALHASDEALKMLGRIGDADPSAPCVLYSREAVRHHAGGCTRYALRPLICRLFGFSAALDKRGDARLSVCGRIKQSSPAMAAVSRGVVRAGLNAPVFSHYASRARALAPPSARTLAPINLALKEAIEQTGYRLSLLGG